MPRRFRSSRIILPRVPLRKLVAFQLGSDRYTIPIESVQYILKEFTSQGALSDGKSLIQYNQRPVTLFDLSVIFLSAKEQRELQYLIICTLTNGEYLGIPIPEMPTILEIAADKFEDLPELYRSSGIPSAIEKVIRLSENNLAFCINLDKLFA